MSRVFGADLCVFRSSVQESSGPHVRRGGRGGTDPGDDRDARTGRAALCKRDGGGSGVSDVASNHRRCEACANRRHAEHVAGFGGANTCVVLAQRLPTATPGVHTGRAEALREVFITGIGVVVPGAVGNEAFLAKLSGESPDAWERDTGGIAEEQYIHLLNARRIRRMSEQVKLTLAATAIACQDAGITDVASVRAAVQRDSW